MLRAAFARQRALRRLLPSMLGSWSYSTRSSDRVHARNPWWSRVAGGAAVAWGMSGVAHWTYCTDDENRKFHKRVDHSVTSQWPRRSTEPSGDRRLRTTENPDSRSIDITGFVMSNGESSEDEETMERRTFIMPSENSRFKIFAGNGNRELATEVAFLLGTQLGRAHIGSFADGETRIRVLDHVRGEDVYVIQPTGVPANDLVMELLLLISTLRRASAARITAIIPYFSYARQLDQRSTSSIAGADVALMLEAVGVDQVVCIDLHKPQVQGFFDTSIPCENLSTTKAAVPYFLSKELVNPVVVSPCGSGFKRATTFQSLLARKEQPATLALLYERDEGGFVDSDYAHHRELATNSVMEVVGDVDGKDCIIVDDMIDTGSRVCLSAQVLKEAGARRVFAYTTHGLLTGDAVDLINNSELSEVVIFNTVRLPPQKWSPIIRQLSCSGLVAECIKRLSENRSLDSLLNN